MQNYGKISAAVAIILGFSLSACSQPRRIRVSGKYISKSELSCVLEHMDGRVPRYDSFPAKSMDEAKKLCGKVRRGDVVEFYGHNPSTFQVIKESDVVGY